MQLCGELAGIIDKSAGIFDYLGTCGASFTGQVLKDGSLRFIVTVCTNDMIGEISNDAGISAIGKGLLRYTVFFVRIQPMENNLSNNNRVDWWHGSSYCAREEASLRRDKRPP